MKTKHLLSVVDLTPEEIVKVLHRALEMKHGDSSSCLQGKMVVLLFEKPSLRTKVSFDVAVQQLGGHPIYLTREEVGMGTREPVPDVARVISRYASALVVRTFAQSTLETLANHSSIPVINALSNDEHPCQALADLLTLYEKEGQLKGLTLAYVGDGNNVATSLALATASVGTNFTIASPRGYQIPRGAWREAERRASLNDCRVTWIEEPEQAVKDADVIYTDVWVSMGQEEETQRRREVFSSYRVDEELLAQTKAGALLMHPLPAHPGEEVSEGVLYGPRSVVFDQAENRLHVQKAILETLVAR